MTREEVIQGLQFTIEMFLFDPSTGETLTEPRNNLDKATIDACKGAIELLKQQPCEDCISREAVIEDVIKCTDMNEDTMEVLEDKVRALPSVTPQPETGRCMRKTKVDGVYDIAGVKTWGIKCQCNRCDFTTTVIEDFGYYSYCPNCGAKMEVEE